MALAEINWNPSTRDLKQFGTIWLPALLTLFGGMAYFYAQTPGVAVTFWAVAGLAAITGFVSPTAIRPAFVGIMCLTFPIGFVVSHAIFLSVFYLVVTPIGLLMRLAGRDAMQRTLDPSADTYWHPYTQETNQSRYLRQF